MRRKGNMMKKLACAVLFVMSVVNPALCGQIVITTSDYSTGNTALYDPDSGAFSDNVLPHFHDAVPKTDGTSLYLLEAFGADNIIKYDPAVIAPGKEIYQYSVGVHANPHDIVFLESKAYVLRYSTDAIWVVNQNAPSEDLFKIDEIDLSAWADSDGSPEPHRGFVYGGMVYVLLQMYDLTAFAPDISRLIAIDPANDTIVDMDPEQDGVQGIDLIIRNVTELALLDDTLFLAGTSYGAYDEGVVTLDMDDPQHTQKKVISEKELGGLCAGVDVFNHGFGIVYTYDEYFNTIPFVFDPDTGTLGRKLPVPDANGGVLMGENYLFVGSGYYENPGIIIVDPYDNVVVETIPVELPPYAMVLVGEVENGLPVIVEDAEEMPESIILEAVQPNPFNPSTTISFMLSRPNRVTISVFNSIGQRVETIGEQYLDAGRHAIVWNAAGRASGVYYVRIDDGMTARVARATLLR